MSKKLSFVNSKGLKLVGVLEEPNTKEHEVVIIVHGYGADKNSKYAKGIAEELIKKNINSFRFDLNGCGESQGKFEEQNITNTSDDIVCAINFLKKKGYTKIDLFGISAGGLSAMAAALKYPQINKLGLKAPVADYASQRIEKLGQTAIDNWKYQGYMFFPKADGRKLKVNYSFFEDIKKYVMYTKVKNITCPVLIIHGMADTTVNPEQSKALIKCFPKAKLMLVENAGHMLEIDGDGGLKVNRIFAEFFKKQ